MDKQRIFWVILAVTGLAVVVLVAGVFLLRPKAAGEATPLADTGVSPYEYQTEIPPTSIETKKNEPEVVRIVIGEQSGKTTGPGAAVAPQPAAPATTETRPEASSRPAAQPAARPAAKPAAKPAEKTAAKPEAKPAQRIEYWIQAASYKSQSAAEDLSRRLADKGLAGRVISLDQRSETWYRVRIGPYSNKQEAEKFLDLVKKIQGLEASYVSQVTAPGA